MNKYSIVLTLTGWIFGAVVMVIGILNLFLVHAVPGIAYILISLVYIPPANAFFKKLFGFSIPLAIKIFLGVFIIMFTLGVSDLGDMFDKL